jgi:hypothetical protein
MAVDLTLKSVELTARDATPSTVRNPGLGGVTALRTKSGYLASVTASLSVTSIIRLVEVPAHCFVKRTRTFSAAQTAGKFDIGVYNKGGAVIDADLFNAALDCASAVNGTTDTLTNYTIAKRQQRLWEAAGMSTEPAPGTMLEIAATVVTTDVTTGAGALYIEVDYAV